MDDIKEKLLEKKRERRTKSKVRGGGDVLVI
jgi:hypothetical protein